MHMGLGSSRRRRRRMESENENDESVTQSSGAAGVSTSDGERDTDLVTLLRFLVRSGNVSIISRGGQEEEDDEEEDDDDEYGQFDDYVPNAVDRPQSCSNPKDAEALKESELSQRVLADSGQGRQRFAYQPHTPGQVSVSKMLSLREIGMRHSHRFTPGDQRYVASAYLPNTMEVKQHYGHKAFCGIYANSGDIFLSACQDRCLRIYDTTLGQFRRLKTVKARDVGWSVLDTAFSPDGNFLIYSSWSEYIHLVNIYGETETHTALPLCPVNDHSFCIFSLTFSDDNSEIMGGSNDGHIYVFDREKNERTLRIDAHEDDVNTVRFADASSNILTSGGDDGLIKVWDRRTLKEDSPEPVGVLAGHTDGTTYIDNKGDGRYLVSNSKDQTIKLWDLRNFSSSDAQDATRRAVAAQRWDYRWQQPMGKRKPKRLQGDSSLMTYRGHSVLHTLVRCRFSPQFSTGQRYIYTGCASGAVVIYDVLTGQVTSRLVEHNACVRDVSWHPYENNLVSTSWDGRVGMWTYSDPKLSEDDMDDGESDGDVDDDDGSTDSDTGMPKPRRSKRLNRKRKQGRGSFWQNIRRHIIMD